MRIAIINDSAIATEALRRVVRSDPALSLAWTAADGEQGAAKAQADPPDLILMDLIMPRVDGVEATRRIMADRPCPILVVTATVTGHIDKVYEAMAFGALDAVNTPTLGAGGVTEGGEELLRKIRQVAALSGAIVEGPATAAGPTPYSSTSGEFPAHPRPQPLVVIGASTGGPKALAELLSALPEGWPAAVVVAQHIDRDFAPGLARWLGEHSSVPVRTSEPRMVPEPGTVTLSCTNDHMVLRRGGHLDHVREPVAAPYRPSVDVFFESVAQNWMRPDAAVILTGMGSDGASGLLTLRRSGWLTIAQDRESCAVFGMPRAAAELGAADAVLPPDQIAEALVRWAARRG
ncbi:chemotaxis-specific protein-glutamate methyltransferase CheB [Tautonia sociabilis]|uniref:Protein-glutamate methylesterase/protein-glutamine glutaminase n=1 Tax=Tautonia sociabilis TaxID=2080755 RepID=A0A432MJD8_9BACT|nr:chemotaxis-specific protein-glutamate methyltransferase CheB [Tautonia sociabilis]RUL87504.1 chemotaxis-specific protein-glutamate methyltransferase CheB [Tautonia sociabilis]